MSANCKANGLFWVAVIMLVVELLFALLLNQVLVTMVSQTKYSKQEEKVARWWLRRTFWHTIGLVVIVLYECRKKLKWVISLIVFITFFMPIRTGENLGKCFFRCGPGETRCSLSTLAPFPRAMLTMFQAWFGVGFGSVCNCVTGDNWPGAESI